MAKVKITGRMPGGGEKRPSFGQQNMTDDEWVKAAHDLGIIGNDGVFCHYLDRYLRQIERENPREVLIRSVFEDLPPGYDATELLAQASDSRVAYIIGKVSELGGRGITANLKADGRRSELEAALIGAIAPRSQEVTLATEFPSFFPNPLTEAIKYVLMLRDTVFSVEPGVPDEQIMELGLFLSPWYGLTSHERGGMQKLILQAARSVQQYSDIHLTARVQSVFSLDDIIGFGHALSLTRQIVERSQKDMLQRNEKQLGIRHLMQNLNLSAIEQYHLGHDQLELELEAAMREGEEESTASWEHHGRPQGILTVEMLEMLPEMLREEVLYRDATLHYLSGLENGLFGAEVYHPDLDLLVDQTIRILRGTDMKGFNVSRDDCAVSIGRTITALQEYGRAISEAKEIYRGSRPDDELFAREAEPILRTYSQFLLGLPFVDTFGPGGPRGTKADDPTPILPVLFGRFYDLH